VNQALTEPVFDTTLTTPEGFKVWRPGLMAYRDAQAHQEALVAQRLHWPFDLLLLLEHSPVITLSRKTDKQNILWTDEALQGAGIDCVASRRGGDITLHNPGQLVGYPIVDLNHYQRDLHRFLRLLEEILIRTLADFDVTAFALPGKTGVWVDGRKIASIGIAVRRWISYHGFALNIDNDLSVFKAIIPCGLPDITMTSMSSELGRPINKDNVAEALIHHFGSILQRPFLGSFNGNPSATET
jgi:lipoyl(octanoyl) transferase